MTRRIGTEQSATRGVILDVTERLMVEEGYAALSTRRVAAAAGLKPSLVHYYFPTTDDLLLTCYRRAADNSIERMAEAVAAARPLHSLWSLSIDPARTALALEFMALANHRKSIRAEIAAYAEKQRALQAKAFEAAEIRAQSAFGPVSAAGLSFIIAGIARALVLEEGLGVVAGHQDAKARVEAWLDMLEPPPQP